ncbi:MAG: MFS transporter [Alphaproteobacteria bacterium]|nr:MFS transporter [Alphaproteobacteria bacterium]MCB9930756.1 MFS transporter [Alphaproteobacteria bacterium]
MTSPARTDVWSLLHDSQFRRVWLAGATVGIMRWLDVLAVGVYTHQVTGDPLIVATMLFLRMLPMLLFGAVIGAWSERVNRKYLLMTGILFVALVYAVLGLLSYTGRITLVHVGIGAALSGLFWATEMPVRRTMSGEVAGTERIGAAMGLESSTNNFTRMLGPSVGGMLLEFIGLYGAFFMGAILYTIGAILIAGVSAGTETSGRGTSIVAVMRDGWATIRQTRLVQAALVVTIFVNFWGFSYVSMVPVIGKVELGLSPFPIGILMSAEGCGAFIGALLIAFNATPPIFGRIFWFGSLLYLAMIFGFSVAPAFGMALPVLFLGGFGIAGFATMQSALILANTPPERRNRVMGVLAMCIGFGPLGILHVGFLADQFGAAVAVSVISAEGFVALCLAGYFWPELRRLARPAVEA